ncbi:aldehyde dehydrogenase family protein [Tundrisphaera lichenicola]|uniref:aldehyde dehydrogenase family protein n=1 Tax=Tundrisphaera lichenicola TaxID=2029860 RepID=UPI003EC15027
MTIDLVSSDFLSARNPATGSEIARVVATPSGDVDAIVARASAAQALWARLPWNERRIALRRWWAVLSRDADDWAHAIRDEVGKPTGEAMAEVVATLDALRWTVHHAGRALADERLGAGWQRILLIPPARIRWVPLGVIGIIGTWNYPLLLNAPEIAHALAAGNAVVWKPSELAIGLGRRLQDSIVEAGLPEGLVSAVYGGPEVGRALVASEIDKGVFTGGVESGRSVLGELGRRGIPTIAELSGFDPAIILPDAPRDSTIKALTWASFVGAGQTCVAVKRVYFVGDARPWAEALAERARGLRVGDPAGGSVDVGPMISPTARDRFHAMISAAIDAGAEVLAGGSPLEGPGSFYPPTVLMAETPEPEQALSGCFGPVVIVRGMPDPDLAVEAANASRFGLSASVWGRDLRKARALAARLEAGMVAVNEAVTPSAHASAPFGGRKASGFGRTRGVVGLRELAQPQVIQVRNPGGFRPHLFPYGDRMLKIFSVYRRFFHPGG